MPLRIKQHTEATEKPKITLLFTPGENINDFTPGQEEAEIKRRIKDFDAYRVTDETDTSGRKTMLSFSGASFAASQDISAIAAPSKAFKTSLGGMIAAVNLSENGKAEGCEFLEAEPNTESKAVLLFDTEQSEADLQYLGNTALRRIGLQKTPDNFLAYSLRALSYKKYKGLISEICEAAQTEFGGLQIVIIDGGADLLGSVNDETEAHDTVQYFIQLATAYNCPVIVMVHQNPGSDKERGHFGSEIQRKCYGLLTLQRDGDTVTVQPKMMRKAGNGDVQPVHLSYSKEKGYVVQVDEVEKFNMKAVKDRSRLRILAGTIFGTERMRYTAAVHRIMKHTDKKTTAAKGDMSNMIGFGIIQQDAEKMYYLSPESEKVAEVDLGSPY